MKKGFTLVEIMIVVAIVALLAAIAIPNLLRARINAQMSNAQATLRTISTGAESYAAANNGIYPSLITDMTTATPPYLNEDYTASARQGYGFVCTLTTISYSCVATPVSCNVSGSNIYTIITGGVLTSVAC